MQGKTFYHGCHFISLLNFRTDSFGSARSSPKSLHTQRTSSPKRRSDEDLISIDFSRLGKNSASDTKRFPFGGGGPGGSFDYDREKREKEDNNRRDREKAAMDLKRKEEWEARELAEKKRELERKIQAKKDRKLEKGRGKDREKDKDHDHDKEFRPKADSGIADCTPSSSFSGKKDHKNDGMFSKVTFAWFCSSFTEIRNPLLILVLVK